MVIGRERDRAHRILPHAMLVHVALHPHGETLGRRKHAIGHQIGLLARDGVDTGGLAETAVLALRQRAEHHHAIGQSRDDGRRGVGDCRTAAASSAAPLHRRRPQAVNAERRGQPRRLAAVIAVGGEAVDVARVDSGIRAGRQDRLQRQLEFRIGRGAVAIIISFADADDGDTSPERTVCGGPGHHAPTFEAVGFC